MEYFLLVLIVFGIFGAIGSALLQPSNRGGIGFALGFFLGPIGIIIAAVMRLDRSVPSAASKKCPDCAETILAEARKCRFCGADISAIPAAAVATGYHESVEGEATRLGRRRIFLAIASMLIAVTLLASWIQHRVR